MVTMAAGLDSPGVQLHFSEVMAGRFATLVVRER
jgi:hypothetical protein